jgi:PAS domain S-box-containing protein
MTHTPDESEQQLRRLAEEKLRRTEVGAPEPLTPEAARELLHELRVHQIELEMRNDELRRTQHELEASRARYFDLYNLAPVGYLSLSGEGIVKEANLTCANLLGVAGSELVGQPFSRFVASEDQELYYLHRKELIETKTPQTCELRMVRPDASMFWAQMQGVYAQGADGSDYRVIVHDCTRRKLAEIEAEKIKEQWEKTFDTIDNVITIHDRSMRIIRANKAAGALLGMEPGELAGKHCHQVFRQASEPCAGCPEVLARLTRTPCRANIHHEHLDKTFVVTAYPLAESRDGSDYLCVAKDISESLKGERLLRQMDKMEAVGVLAGGIAHDFNNILFPILGYAELAQFRISPDDPLTSSYLQKIVQGALRAKEMTTQILSFSGQVPAQQYAFSPHLVVKEALSMLQVSLPAEVEIVTDIAADCGNIMADPAQFYRVVMELCTNAFHAMKEKGGVLRVGLNKVTLGGQDGRVSGSPLVPGDYIDLEVSDTGVGMEPAVVDRVYDIYFTTKKMGQGGVVGLSVVYGIVKSSRGQITVRSEPGKGTTFHVYLPRVAKDEAVEVKKAEPVPVPSGTERILVVDDEKLITSLYEAILESFGYQAIIFNSSPEALDFITREPQGFDLMITDMSMPHMNGLDLSRRALAIRPDLPIILCTGYSELANEEKAREIGIQAYLMKPLVLDDLLLAMRKVLDKKG